MSKIKRKRNPQDATMRNVRSLRAAIEKNEAALARERDSIDSLASRVLALEAWNIKVWVAGQAEVCRTPVVK